MLYACQRRAKLRPKGPSAPLIAAVLEMKRRNPNFGRLKIAQQISYAVGVELNKDVVRRILQRHSTGLPHGLGPYRLSTRAHAKDSSWSVDLFRCKSIMLKSDWVMAIIEVFSRRVIGVVVEPGDNDGPIVCRMLNRVRAQQGLPKYLSTDHDPCSDFLAASPTCA